MRNARDRKKNDHGFPKNKYNPYAWVTGNPKIGEGTWIGAFTLIDGEHAELKIGKGCNIASGAQILTHSTVRRCISEGKIDVIDAKETTIGDYCFIGAGAVILMGSHIGHHSVIGAGCIVPEGTEIPPYSIVAGVPAKIIGSSKKYLKR